MSTHPLEAEEIQSFLDALDQAGENLRELIDAEDTAASPSIQYYLDGSIFLEVGYLMVEQLGEKFPDIFRVLHENHYWPNFERARKGQVGWGEALAELPQFLREYATEKVHQDLFAGEEEG